MPQTAAENFARAVDRVRDTRLSEREHEVAVGELLSTHAELLRKQGVETAPRRALGQLVSAALLLAVIVSMALNFSYAVTAHETANQANQTAESLQVLQEAIILNQRKGCERANRQREGEVTNLESDVSTLTGTFNLWAAALAEASQAEREALEATKTGAAFKSNLERLRKGIAHKERAIRHLIQSQRSVAEKPGSPRVDCDKTYPLNRSAARVLRQQFNAPMSAPSGPLGRRDLEVALNGE